jgi:hypothetical protein
MAFWLLSGVATIYAFIILWLAVELWRAPLLDEEGNICTGDR